MAWTFEFTKKAQKQLNDLDGKTQKKIKEAILKKLVVNPKQYLSALVGDKAGYYRFRIGDYRLLCSRDDDDFHVLIVKIKHRKAIYRR